MIKPLQYAIYKGKTGKWGAVQFNIQNPHYYCSNLKCRAKNFESPIPTCTCQDVKMIAREGAIFMEITSPKAADVYDWEKKTVIALSVNDMGKMLSAMRTGTELKLMHDPGAKSDNAGKVRKTISLTFPKGVEAGGMLVVFESNELTGAENTKHVVPISFDELTILGTLFQRAIPKCLGW